MSTTAPVTKDGFASANGDFYAEASGSNRHRRATPAELESHFKASGKDKDPPAHWYEAQLVHYGLKPSKTKSVAFRRLFDAVNAGNLGVPAHIKKIEAELKKEWTKKDREAKKEAKGQTSGAQKSTGKSTAPKQTAGAKRKAQDNVGTVSTNSSTAAQGAAKKAKTTTAKPKVVPKAAAARKDTTISSQSAATAPKKKQMARCSRGGLSQGPGRSRPPSSPVQSNMPRQYARRGGLLASRARGRLGPSSRDYDDHDNYDHDDDDDEDDDLPPPYSEYNDNRYGSSSRSSSSSRSYDQQPLEKLGLLNGRYSIESPYVSEEWPFVGDDFGLVLTLDGSKLWGSFDLGIFEGILRFDVRPYESSYEPLDFTWRGRENQGEIICGDSNTGWIKFLGGGRIEGYLDRMSIEFSGRRISGQGTRSEVDAASMKREWNDYSEDEYDRENRSRWGGSSW